ncbi:MAG TPA: hypothetical protein VM925_06050 [Labilithrix sp.]|nr:hypothetical protein [Labilithrix sp.]
MNDGKFGDACPKLAASQRLDPGAGTLMNLATCYEKNGQIASAWSTFKEAASAARLAGRLEWEKAARERASKLEPDLPRLTIVVAPEADVPGLVVLRDGLAVDRAEWGTAIPIDAGTHHVEATGPKKKKWSTETAIAGTGARGSVSVPILAAEDAAPPSETKPATHDHDASPQASLGSGRKVLGLVTAGVGVIGVGIGAAFGLMAKSTHDDALAHCHGNRLCDPEGVRLGDEASAKAAVSTVGFVAGGLLIATGAVLYLTAPKEHSSTTAIFLAPAPAGGAMGMRGTF